MHIVSEHCAAPLVEFSVPQLGCAPGGGGRSAGGGGLLPLAPGGDGDGG
jgi:hypothetical protein